MHYICFASFNEEGGPGGLASSLHPLFFIEKYSLISLHDITIVHSFGKELNPGAYTSSLLMENL